MAYCFVSSLPHGLDLVLDDIYSTTAAANLETIISAFLAGCVHSLSPRKVLKVPNKEDLLMIWTENRTTGGEEEEN